MLSAAKHLCARRDRYFAEFTLERSEGLSMTELDLSNAEKLSSSFEPGLKRYAYRRLERKGSACETGSYRHCPTIGASINGCPLLSTRSDDFSSLWEYDAN